MIEPIYVIKKSLLSQICFEMLLKIGKYFPVKRFSGEM